MSYIINCSQYGLEFNSSYSNTLPISTRIHLRLLRYFLYHEAEVLQYNQSDSSMADIKALGSTKHVMKNLKLQFEYNLLKFPYLNNAGNS